MLINRTVNLMNRQSIRWLNVLNSTLILNKNVHQSSRKCVSSSTDARPLATVATVSRAASGSVRIEEASQLAEQMNRSGSRYRLPIDTQLSCRLGRPIPRCEPADVGQHSEIGQRRQQEDRIVVDQLRDFGVLVVAVFDGHGGADVAEYLRQHFVDALQLMLARDAHDMGIVIKRLFHQLDIALKQFLRYADDAPTACPGSTATVCLLRNGVELVVGHLGDSRAILCRDGNPVALHVMHNCENAAERTRVERAKGRIAHNVRGEGLLQGRLAMTRSFGNFDLRSAGLSVEPATRSFGIKHYRDAFIVLSTDGVNNALNDREVCNIVSDCETPKEAARTLVEQALAFSSEDNSTAVVVPLGAWGKFAASQPSDRFSLGRSLASSTRGL